MCWHTLVGVFRYEKYVSDLTASLVGRRDGAVGHGTNHYIGQFTCSMHDWLTNRSYKENILSDKTIYVLDIGSPIFGLPNDHTLVNNFFLGRIQS